MEWNKLESHEMLQEAVQKSFESPVVIFKHSNRCSISSMALNRIRSIPENAKPYIVDVIRQRDISDGIANAFGVPHQSPQMLIIYRGKCISDSSHLEISPKSMEAQIGTL